MSFAYSPLYILNDKFGHLFRGRKLTVPPLQMTTSDAPHRSTGSAGQQDMKDKTGRVIQQGGSKWSLQLSGVTEQVLNEI